MLFKVPYTNTVLKICQNRRLYMKIICCKLLKLCLHSETIESWCRGFLTYEITMPWLYCLSFSMLRCFSFPNLDFASFWSLNLDVVFFRSWDLYVVYICHLDLVFVFTVKYQAKSFQSYYWKIFQLSKFMQRLSI